MQKFSKSKIPIFALVLFFLSGCAPAATPPSPTPTFTVVPPTSTLIPTEKVPIMTQTITPLYPEKLDEYLKWRELVFSIDSEQVDVVTEEPGQIYGVIMDVGLSDDFIITITAFPTGEASLRTTLGGGVIGLGGDAYVAEHAKDIVTLGQSLLETTIQTDYYNLPTSEKVYFYFLTTSGLMLNETTIAEVSNPTHPFSEMFGLFTEIKRRSEELSGSGG